MTETLGAARHATDEAKSNPLTDVAHSSSAFAQGVKSAGRADDTGRSRR